MRVFRRLGLAELRREWVRVALAGVGISLIVVHGTAPSRFSVDTTTLGLLAFILVILVLPQITELTLFGNTIRFRENLERTTRSANRVDAQSRLIAPDREPDEPDETPPHKPATEAMRADPVGSVTADRLRVSKAILDLYRSIYARESDELGRAITQLEGDGYLAEGLGQLALDLLDLTHRALRYDSVDVHDAAAIRDATEKFFLSVGRISSLRFEDKVEDALRRLPDARVERRPESEFRGRRTIQPDFVVTTGHERFVVEAYLPQGEPLPRRVDTRIDDRFKRFVEPLEASGLIVVLPDGVPDDIVRKPVRSRVQLLTIGELRARVAAGTLFNAQDRTTER